MSSIKETIVDTTTRVLTTLGASEESAKYIKERMGNLLDQVETRVTGVPQVKDVEQLWFTAYTLKLAHDDCSKRKFAQEAITRGVEHMPGDRFVTICRNASLTFLQHHKLLLLNKQLTVQSYSCVRGVDNRFTTETTKLNAIRRDEAEALAAYNAAVEKASAAQAKIEAAKKKA